MGKKESVKDTARVLGRMYDAIEYRGSGQKIVEELAEYSGVPVFNGLTDEFHPTQMCADLMTMREYMPQPWHDFNYAYVGDARSNMGNSLMIAGCLMGMDVRIAAPRQLWPNAGLLEYARELEKKNKGTLTLTEDPYEAVKGVQFIHTDVWVSMGEAPEVWEERINVAQALPGQCRTDGRQRQPQGALHALPAGVPQPRNRGWPGCLREIRYWMPWRLPRRFSSLLPVSSLNRRKIACIRSRHCWWQHWVASDDRTALLVRGAGQISARVFTLALDSDPI